MQPRSKSFYDRWGNHLKQQLQNCFTNANVKLVGSRANDKFKRKSDMDFQFCLQGGYTSKTQIYPKVVECLLSKLKGKYIQGETIQNVQLGTSGNVVNVTFQNGGKISFALMDCNSM